MRLAICALAAAVWTAAEAVPVAYRDPADGRAWAVVFDAAELLVWQWK